MDFQDKKEKVLGGKKRDTGVLILLTIIALALGGVCYWLISGDNGAKSKLPPNRS